MIIDHDKVTLLEKSGYLVICSHNRNVSMIDVKPCLGWPPDLDGQSHSWPLPGYPQSQTLILPLSPIYLSTSVTMTQQILVHHAHRLCSENSSRRNHDQRNYALVAKASKQSFICRRTFENNRLNFLPQIKTHQNHPQ